MEPVHGSNVNEVTEQLSRLEVAREEQQAAQGAQTEQAARWASLAQLALDKHQAYYSTYTQAEPLSVKNAHPRDAIVHHVATREQVMAINDPLAMIFWDNNDLGKHFYLFKFGPHYTVMVSPSTYQKPFFEPFNGPKMAAHCCNNPNKPQYAGMTVQQILDKWHNDGQESAHFGSLMHEYLENYFNKTPQAPPTPDFDIEIGQFHILWPWLEQKFPDWEVYRVEWIVYDEDSNSAGMIDIAMRHKIHHHLILILDWKRSKEIKTMGYVDQRKKAFLIKQGYPEKEAEQRASKKALGFMSQYDDCNLVKYGFSLNWYQKILQTKYGMQVLGRHLISFHRNEESFGMWPCHDMQREMNLIWQRAPFTHSATVQEVFQL